MPGTPESLREGSASLREPVLEGPGVAGGRRIGLGVGEDNAEDASSGEESGVTRGLLVEGRTRPFVTAPLSWYNESDGDTTAHGNPGRTDGSSTAFAFSFASDSAFFF